ncbi:PAS domain S-box protein [Paenibacillus sp. P25]|nr:PAS domain S-box protein [Paenibacillus sp. P25]
MGTAMAGTHFAGMGAIRFPGTIHYDAPLAILSVLIAYTIPFTALAGSRSKPSSPWEKGMISFMLGMVMAGMHYTGMHAADFRISDPHAAGLQEPAGTGEILLAYWIGAVMLIILLLIAVNQASVRKLALRLAELSRQRYDSIFEHNPDMVCLFDTKGRLIRTNPAAERITGYKAEAFVDKPFTRFLNRRDSLRIKAGFAKALQGLPQTVECTIRHKDGHPVHLSTTIVPLSAGGSVVDVYTISKDVTEQKKAALELIEAKMKAEQAAQSKSEFLAIMSHEIRTPLNGVIGMSQVLMETGLSEEQMSYVNIIGKSGTALLSVINDVLDFSRMESGKLQSLSEPFDLQECLHEIVQLFMPQISERRLSMQWQLDPELPEVVIGDVNRLRQVLINLIGNAVKFTENGGLMLQ